MEHKYEIYLYPGMGYSLTKFECAAFAEEQALEIIAAQLIEEERSDYYMTCEELQESKNEECEDEMEFAEALGYVYIDGTMEGAKYPIFLNLQNAIIRELPNA